MPKPKKLRSDVQSSMVSLVDTTKNEAAQFQEDLVEHICMEFDTQQALPRCIAGDVNAEAEDILTFMHLVHNEKLGGLWGI